MAIERCCFGRRVAAVRHGRDSRSFTYYSMQSLRGTFELFEAEGTVFGAVSKKDFQSMPWVCPSDGMVAQFDASCSALDSRIATDERETVALAAQRDALLPKQRVAGSTPVSRSKPHGHWMSRSAGLRILAG